MTKHWPSSWNPPVPAPSNMGSARSFQRDTERKKKSWGTTRLCSEVTHKYTDVRPGPACNPHYAHTVRVAHHSARASGYTWSYIPYTEVDRTATDRRWKMSQSNTPHVRNRASLTTRSSSLRRISAAEHHTEEQYFKTGRTKPQKHLSRSDLSWNTRQDFLKIPSLWEAALETKRRCFSKVSLEQNVTQNITWLSDSFSTVPAIVIVHVLL